MGTYINYDGLIDFKTKKAYDAFVKMMNDAGLYDKKTDSWIGDSGPIDDETDPDDKVPVLLEGDGIFAVILPNYPLDNIQPLILALEKDSWDGEIRATVDDGDFAGYIIQPNSDEEYFDLAEWAKEHNQTLNWDDEHDDWDTGDRHDVMDAFIENPRPPTNSMKFIVDK